MSAALQIFKVSTRDVDGGDSRRYRTLASAVKRFEEMSGLTVQQALDERYYSDDGRGNMPAADFLQKERFSLSAVSMFGTVVVLEARPA